MGKVCGTEIVKVNNLASAIDRIEEKYVVSNILPYVCKNLSGNFIEIEYVILYREKDKNPYDNIKVI